MRFLRKLLLHFNVLIKLQSKFLKPFNFAVFLKVTVKLPWRIVHIIIKYKYENPLTGLPSISSFLFPAIFFLCAKQLLKTFEIDWEFLLYYYFTFFNRIYFSIFTRMTYQLVYWNFLEYQITTNNNMKLKTSEYGNQNKCQLFW